MKNVRFYKIPNYDSYYDSYDLLRVEFKSTNNNVTDDQMSKNINKTESIIKEMVDSLKGIRIWNVDNKSIKISEPISLFLNSISENLGIRNAEVIARHIIEEQIKSF